MGHYSSEAIAAAFRKSGVNASALPVYNSNVLKVGRGNSTCKECLPLQLTAGSMVDHYLNHRQEGEKTLFFMTTGDGPCRLGQYQVFLNALIKKRQLRDLGVFCLTDEDNFSGFDDDFNKRTWESLVIGDVMQSIDLAIEAIAVDKKKAREILRKEWTGIVKVLESGNSIQFLEQLKEAAANLAEIEKKCSYKSAPKVALIGEIFVRNDEFSRMNLIQKLSEHGVIVKVAPVVEYLHYANYIIKKGLTTNPLSFAERVKFRIRETYQKKMELDMRQIMALSGLCDAHITDIDSIIDRGKNLVNPALTGETILTIGSALEEILDHVAGVISIGPFGCMPSRVAESILAVEMNITGKMSTNGKDLSHLQEEINELPFLAIETDGNPFPQIIQSRLEIFLLQTKRLHEKMQNLDFATRKSYADSFKKILYMYGNGFATDGNEYQHMAVVK
jgi:predicted nucleotide-binding protein (sugar kinase/HSP70/actin superfamily)